MTKSKTILWVLCSLSAVGVAVKGQELDEGFINPPDSAKPWAYWWWLDSYATKEGITKDLEEMKRQGISGVLLFDAGDGKDSPDGPVFMSEQWRALFKHAVDEAHQLKIEMGVNLCSGWNAGGTWVKPEHACKKLVYSSIEVQGPRSLIRVLPKPQVMDDYYRDIAVVAFKIDLGEKQQAVRPIKNFKIKAGRIKMVGQGPDQEYEYYADVPGEQDLNSSSLVDLSNHMDQDGRLEWQVPEGKWSVQRFGYTLYGQKTKVYSPGSQGYEIDPFMAEAMDMHFAETAQKLIDDAGPLTGKTLKYFHIDSWEINCPTWTDKFRQEFKARRGYDLLSYLPVLTGKIVDSRDISNRFLWDYRKTIGDLIVDNYYGRLADLSHRYGMGTHSESAGYQRPNVDALRSLGVNDIPMTEFWARQTEPDGKIHQMYPAALRAHDAIKLAASAAHIYGKELCQAEAFTTMGPNWEKDPYMLKDIGDWVFCQGLTRNVLCFYVHQARLDIKPGYQWEAAGTHFDRNITWWPQIHAWLKYLSRCQFLLKQGHFVADVCYFYGEDVPNYVPAKRVMNPPLPVGYDCDTINADVLLNRMVTKDGRLVLPDGMSYRYLVLPHRSTPAMSVKVLQKIKELVEAGATIIGPKPQRAPGLTDYPQCDEDVRRLADELWGDQKGHGRRVDQGRIIWGKGLEEILRADGLRPDFGRGNQSTGAKLDYIHRRSKGTDIYFISNQRNRQALAQCIFRVTGKQPEIWCAVTGKRRDATNWRIRDGAIMVPLKFAPRQSWLVVFRRDAAPPEEPAANFPNRKTVQELAGPWMVKFDPQWGGPESVEFEKLVDWTKRPEEGIKYYSGKATYHKTFDLPELSGTPIYLDLGNVKHVAQLRLNGKDLGVVWTAPWSVDISSVALLPKGNNLEIDVVNLWPNRLIGDVKQPETKRHTTTNVKKFKPDSPLLPSGLLGPVKVQVKE